MSSSAGLCLLFELSIEIYTKNILVCVLYIYDVRVYCCAVPALLKYEHTSKQILYKSLLSSFLI